MADKRIIEGVEFTKPHHIQFIDDMEAADIPVRAYSGRGMFGAECPAVTCGRNTDHSEHDVYRATEVGLLKDSMGLGVVLYAR